MDIKDPLQLQIQSLALSVAGQKTYQQSRESPISALNTANSTDTSTILCNLLYIQNLIPQS